MTTYILSGRRTPIGPLMGSLASCKAPELAAVTIKDLFSEGTFGPSDIDLVTLGHVVQAGAGQAPARQGAMFAGLSKSTPCVTVNKVCGSGLEAVIQASRAIETGDAKLALAGGMESMSNAPHLMSGMRTGVKFGEAKIQDALQWDGLWDVYSNQAMGNCAEECAKKYKFSREEQDQFAIQSFKRAQEATERGDFKAEISPVTIQTKKGEIVVDRDEGPFKANFEKIPKLRPAFDSSGTITAANASSLNDGAASLVLGNEDYRSQAKFEIVASASHAQDSVWFTTAPVDAMKKCADKANLKLSDIDLFEINEAFAVVTMAAMKELNLSEEKVNVFGGAIALGHPIGCSGARILVTLMNALEKKNLSHGMASLCIGGGEALAMIIKRL